jgi:hypothetical protein
MPEGKQYSKGHPGNSPTSQNPFNLSSPENLLKLSAEQKNTIFVMFLRKITPPQLLKT